MNIQLWRSGLRTWLSSKILIDSWELRNPIAYGKVNAFIPPLQSIQYLDDSVGKAMALQDVYLTTRYPNTTKYHQLPLGQIEQQYISLCRKLSTGYKDIAPLESLKVLPVADGLQVTEYGDTNADWLVTSVLSMMIEWIPEPTLLSGEVPNYDPDEPDVTEPLPPPIAKIEHGLYTQRLAPPNNRDKYGQVVVRF